MSLIISIFHVVAGLTLILVVLLQAGKDSGLAGAFGAGGGGGASDSVFGAQSNTFLNKFTSGMAILFMVTSLVLAILSSRENRSLVMKQKTEAPQQAVADQSGLASAVAEVKDSVVDPVEESVQKVQSAVEDVAQDVTTQVVQAVNQTVEDVETKAQDVVAKTEALTLEKLEQEVAEAVKAAEALVASVSSSEDKSGPSQNQVT